MSERLYSTDFASVCINHHKPEEHSSVTALKAELAELRQQLAEAQRKLEEARQGNEYWRGCNTELAAERDQLQAQVVVLTEALEPFAAKATTWRPERGSDSVVHVSMPIRYYREAADALANLPASATALREAERSRQLAVEYSELLEKRFVSAQAELVLLRRQIEFMEGRGKSEEELAYSGDREFKERRLAVSQVYLGCASVLDGIGQRLYDAIEGQRACEVVEREEVMP